MSYSIYAYPWNFSVEKPDERANDILSLGLQGINLAVSYHAGKFIHPRSHHRVYFPEDGVIYFEPRSSYARVKPLTSKLLERRDVLALLTERKGLVLNAWTVLFHNTRLGMLYPDITVKNAFGDSYVYSLCPAHPDVRRYALTLCQDLAGHYSIGTLLLETPGYMAYSHGYHHEFAQIQPDSQLDAWLGLCFCDHCMAGAGNAGIDSKSLRRCVQQAIDAYLHGDDLSHAKTVTGWLESDVIENDELKTFLQWRCDIVTSLVREIRAEIHSSVKVKVISTTQNSHTASVLEGHDLPALHKAADGLELPLYQSSMETTKSEGKYVIRELGEVDRLGAILRPGWPDMQCQGQVMDTVASVQALGIQDIAFYNYDMLPSANLCWLKQAINQQGEVY